MNFFDATKIFQLSSLHVDGVTKSTARAITASSPFTSSSLRNH